MTRTCYIVYRKLDDGDKPEGLMPERWQADVMALAYEALEGGKWGVMRGRVTIEEVADE